MHTRYILFVKTKSKITIYLFLLLLFFSYICTVVLRSICRISNLRPKNGSSLYFLLLLLSRQHGGTYTHIHIYTHIKSRKSHVYTHEHTKTQRQKANKNYFDFFILTTEQFFQLKYIFSSKFFVLPSICSALFFSLVCSFSEPHREAHQLLTIFFLSIFVVYSKRVIWAVFWLLDTPTAAICFITKIYFDKIFLLSAMILTFYIIFFLYLYVPIY